MQVAVGFDPIGVVDVRRLQEVEHRNHFRRLDLVLEASVGIGLVADEDELLDAGLVALRDLEHEVDTIVRKVDHLGLDADVEAAVASIDFDDALGVGLYQRAR